jgi:hypothetical protein
MYDRIMAEISRESFYRDNFDNDGQRFVAWYLHRVLLLDVHETRASITDGQNDKQIDAVVVEDGEERRVRVLQGKFVKPEPIDAAPLREVLSAWTRLKDLPKLQLECSGKLAERLETMRLALEDDYDVQFELLTTGNLTGAAVSDFEAFRQEMADSPDFSAGLTLVNSELLETRLSEAERRDLPELMTEIEVEAEKCLAQAKQCLNQALQQAVTHSAAEGKVFSPQNWLKGKSAVNNEQLVAGTIVSVLKGLATPDMAPFISSLTIPPDKFSFLWSAE